MTVFERERETRETASEREKRESERDERERETERKREVVLGGGRRLVLEVPLPSGHVGLPSEHVRLSSVE